MSDLLEYVCPMHPEVRRDGPGRCPECGMALLPEKEVVRGHGMHGSSPQKGKEPSSSKHEGHSLAMFARKFWTSLALTIPVVLIQWEAIPTFTGSSLVVALLGSVVFFYGGLVFLQGAVREVRAKLPGMMTLISIAILTAYLWSVWAVFIGGEALFWELTTLITVMLLGHWLEMRAVQSTQGALKELSKLMPDRVEVVRNGDTTLIPLTELKENDLFIVRPGGKIAADGVVDSGESDIDESSVTGESRPVSKQPGAEVVAGTVNGDGAITVRATKIGEKTFLAGVMRLVTEAQASKSRLQMLSDRAARMLTAAAIGSGAITLVAWLFYAEPAYAVERMVAVLVIACPHALGLAVPLVASISTMLAARNGFLVKQRLALEAAKDIDVVLFDKTGTLTKGAYGVDHVWNFAGGETRDVLRLAAAVDAPSEHVIAKAVMEKAREDGIDIPAVSGFSRIPGKGVKGTLGGEEVSAGGKSLLEHYQGAIAEQYAKEIDAENKKGKSIIYVLKSGQPIGAIALADIIREESREAIGTLKEMGLKVGIITGDSEDVAAWVAAELGIDEVFARVLPQDKAAKVKLLQEKGLRTAMVGDGINDAPALTQADLGIAIGAGTNVAIESAGIILVRNDPRDIPKIITLSRLTYAKMIQNLWWASGYNIVALPLAAGALAFKGIVMQPAWAAVFMSLSTVIVAINAMTLRKAKLGRG